MIIMVNEDEITSLPGLSDPIKFKQYSGYLNASKGRHHFYWFTESESDRQNAPVVLWLSGGPGCSSICGMFMENGPFRANEDGKTLLLHDFAFNKVANMVWMESPVSTGFSYDENTLKPHNNDTTTANDNYLAVESFFAKFPHLRKNPFYLTGESYGGVYVPMLAREILQRKSNINLKGLAIGNGLVDGQPMATQAFVDYALGHGLVTTDWYDRKWEACCESRPGVQSECNFYKPANKTKCDSVPDAKWIMLNNSNPYNLYDECAPDVTLQSWTEDGRVDGRVGGFAQHYENGLSFVLVRGAGHLAPADQPEAALQVLKELTGISKI
ncbi:unnamed protein product [Medioppia subpectinata]|uniref:Carboxypeptidase n=1 Tax=Medioppia subpectinata TaxID=1979941 RepID=A0A7R9Q1H8_9ACAR|nr:unnamed protein product [Medioppia subpectinata]CAG2108324.1 unnamed protein product [Medioppia subpectinata]